jgi:hypothetical protein
MSSDSKRQFEAGPSDQGHGAAAAPHRLLQRNFSYNTFTPPPSTPTLGEPSDPWRSSLPPSRTRTPDLNALQTRLEGYPILEAIEIDTARVDETEGLIGDKDEERADEGGPSGIGRRWLGDEGDEWSNGSGSDAEGSTMSVGVSKVKAAQAVW